MSSSAGASDAEDQEKEEEEEEAEEEEQILRKPDREFSYRDPAVRKACQSVCCVYMSVCARVFTCTYMHITYMHAYIHQLMHSHVMCACMSQHKPLRFFLCAWQACVYEHLCMCLALCMHECIYAYTHIIIGPVKGLCVSECNHKDSDVKRDSTQKSDMHVAGADIMWISVFMYWCYQ